MRNNFTGFSCYAHFVNPNNHPNIPSETCSKQNNSEVQLQSIGTFFVHFRSNFSLEGNHCRRQLEVRSNKTRTIIASTWQRKAVCAEEEFGLIQRKLLRPRTFFVFVNNFWLRSSGPLSPVPRLYWGPILSTKFWLCRTKS